MNIGITIGADDLSLQKFIVVTIIMMKRKIKL